MLGGPPARGPCARRGARQVCDSLGNSGPACSHRSVFLLHTLGPRHQRPSRQRRRRRRCHGPPPPQHRGQPEVRPCGPRGWLLPSKPPPNGRLHQLRRAGRECCGPAPPRGEEDVQSMPPHSPGDLHLASISSRTSCPRLSRLPHARAAAGLRATQGGREEHLPLRGRQRRRPHRHRRRGHERGELQEIVHWHHPTSAFAGAGAGTSGVAGGRRGHRQGGGVAQGGDDEREWGGGLPPERAPGEPKQQLEGRPPRAQGLEGAGSGHEQSLH
mmetsp:Transcript_47867/g.154329  ORF Transcript_47867/g.154329 Transcript_47867/m.154329 type:complete len:271 (+) Transcript_47867:4558-5370(+)